MSKTATGFEQFDRRYGGVCHGRVALLTGRHGAGKSLFCLQFLKQGLSAGESGVILSATPCRDIALQARGLGIDVEDAIATHRLHVLNYNDVVPGRDREQDIMLPPDGFLQLKQVIEDHAISRVALDTVLPWMNLTTTDHLAEHIFSFVRSFERLGVTGIFTLPKPASHAARRLHKLLENVVPVSVSLGYELDTGERTWTVNKYLGETVDSDSVSIRLDPGRGVVAASGSGAEHSNDEPAEAEPKAADRAFTLAGSADNTSAASNIRTPFAKAILRDKKAASS